LSLHDRATCYLGRAAEAATSTAARYLWVATEQEQAIVEPTMAHLLGFVSLGSVEEEEEEEEEEEWGKIGLSYGRLAD